MALTRSNAVGIVCSVAQFSESIKASIVPEYELNVPRNND